MSPSVHFKVSLSTILAPKRSPSELISKESPICGGSEISYSSMFQIIPSDQVKVSPSMITSSFENEVNQRPLKPGSLSSRTTR